MHRIGHSSSSHQQVWHLEPSYPVSGLFESGRTDESKSGMLKACNKVHPERP